MHLAPIVIMASIGELLPMVDLFSIFLALAGAKHQEEDYDAHDYPLEHGLGI